MKLHRRSCNYPTEQSGQCTCTCTYNLILIHSICILSNVNESTVDFRLVENILNMHTCVLHCMYVCVFKNGGSAVTLMESFYGGDVGSHDDQIISKINIVI